MNSDRHRLAAYTSPPPGAFHTILTPLALAVFVLLGAYGPPLAADTGTLIIECDAPCTILIDDQLIFRVEPDDPRPVEVEEGLRDVVALSAEIFGVMWQEQIQIDDDEEQELTIMIAADVEIERDAEGPSEREFMGDRESRLKATDDGTLRDPDTDLEWIRSDNQFDIDWATAQQFCTSLRVGVEPGEATEDVGWRLPTIDELKSLVNDDSDGKYKSLGQLRLSGCCPWSSEGYGTVSAWYMDFENGRKGFVARDYYTGARGLCVR